jgi:hypothetical protein
MSRLRIEYDKNWKEVVKHMVQPFVGFFLPDWYKDVDWSVEPQFLEQELHSALNIKKGKRVTDKLVKVRLLNGEERWIFIHIEFQSDGKKVIGVRMYRYYRRIYDMYGKEITAIVIYTGSEVPKKHNIYENKVYGTSIVYTFNSYAVIKQNEVALLADMNPFAIVVLANYYVLMTKDDSEKRYEFKEKLYELAAKRQYSLEFTNKLLTFVLELMKLPPKLEDKFHDEITSQNNTKSKDMTLSKSTVKFADAVTKNFYGETVEDVRSKFKEELKEKDSKLSKSIILLYTRVDMSIDEISEHLGIDSQEVRKILISNKIIKK